MSSFKTFTRHSDPAHAWFAIPAKLIKSLRLESQISAYSYIKGKTVYLEETDDAPLFFAAAKSTGVLFELKDSYREKTPIRRYEPYSLAALENSLRGWQEYGGKASHRPPSSVGLVQCRLPI